MYLVNKDKLMITESIFIKDAALKQTVDTLPVQRGLEANEEIAGFTRITAAWKWSGRQCTFHQ